MKCIGSSAGLRKKSSRKIRSKIEAMKAYLWYHILAMVIACIVDAVIGDPHHLPHPIRGIGKLITGVEKETRPWFSKTRTGEYLAGFYLVVIVGLIAVLVPTSLTILAYRIHVIAGIAFESVALAYMLAAKSLKKESMAVAAALEKEGLIAGQKAVAMIVGRDTDVLDEDGVIRAAVETVAENTSDGVIAPLFYMLFGVPFVYFYKAVNTMDSMVGYKNDSYRYYGTVAAKLDDVVNFIPSRISAGLLVAATFVCGLFDANYHGKQAIQIFRRDRFNHASPNSAQTESVMAGALGIRLAGPASYFGKRIEKPYIGEENRSLEREDIRRANHLMQTAAWMWVMFEVIILLLLDRLI